MVIRLKKLSGIHRHTDGKDYKPGSILTVEDVNEIPQSFWDQWIATDGRTLAEVAEGVEVEAEEKAEEEVVVQREMVLVEGDEYVAEEKGGGFYNIFCLTEDEDGKEVRELVDIEGPAIQGKVTVEAKLTELEADNLYHVALVDAEEGTYITDEPLTKEEAQLLVGAK